MDHHVLHRPMIPLDRRRRPSSKASITSQDDENSSFYNRGTSQERWQSSDAEDIEEKANTPVALNRKTLENNQPKSSNQQSGMPASIFKDLALEAVAKRQRQREFGAGMAINSFIKTTKSESNITADKKLTTPSSLKERLQAFEKISKAPMTTEQESLTRRISTGSTRSSSDSDEGTPIPLTGMIGILKKTTSENDTAKKIVIVDASSKVPEVIDAKTAEPKVETKPEVKSQVSLSPKAMPALERRSESDLKTPEPSPIRANISAVKFHLPSSASEDRLLRRESSNLSSSDEDEIRSIFMKQDQRGRREPLDSLIFLNGRASRILVQAIRDRLQALSLPIAGISSVLQPLSQLNVVPLEASRRAVLFWLAALWLLWCFVIALLVTVRRYPPKQ